MSTTPREPVHAGPIAGGHLRCADADRDEAVGLLDQAMQTGRLTESEHAARVARARQAVVFDDLFPLTHDLQGPTPSLLPAVTSSSLPATTASTALAVIDPTSTLPTNRNVLAVFGGSTRQGAMLLRKESNAFIAFGGSEIDLSDAVFEATECHLHLQCMFGGLEIRVPAGVNVIDNTFSVFGGSSVKNLDLVAGQPGPTLVIDGFIGFGGLEVKGPKGGPTLAERLGF